jgi:hypothetical protein
MIERISMSLMKERDSYAGGIRASDNPSGIIFPFEFVNPGFSQKAA